ncbi:MAG: hypothetical protein MZV70_74470, partial [Desulfobacterales bacterium]|nr:hypothetical protein [Desulfobacterales bacterium]
LRIAKVNTKTPTTFFSTFAHNSEQNKMLHNRAKTDCGTHWQTPHEIAYFRFFAALEILGKIKILFPIKRS